MGEDKARHSVADMSEITGFMDEGTEFKGEMKFHGTMRIDGKYEGIIKSDSILIIGETADVKAELIEVGSISINGRVDGNITAKEKIEIHERGKVFGSVNTPSLVIDDGAILQGKCNMSKDTVKPKPESETK